MQHDRLTVVDCNKFFGRRFPKGNNTRHKPAGLDFELRALNRQVIAAGVVARQHNAIARLVFVKVHVKAFVKEPRSSPSGRRQAHRLQRTPKTLHCACVVQACSTLGERPVQSRPVERQRLMLRFRFSICQKQPFSKLRLFTVDAFANGDDAIPSRNSGRVLMPAR